MKVGGEGVITIPIKLRNGSNGSGNDIPLYVAFVRGKGVGGKLNVGIERSNTSRLPEICNE